MEIKHILWSIVLLFQAVSLWAQTPNDDIENSLYLEQEQAFLSNTRGCTVQPNCVDEGLTGKCIDYHNDQWFTFNAHGKSTLFVNIFGQNCRDLKGVQLVVLKGEPCNVETYEILTCVSLSTQDDIYVELDSLQHNQEYLINIDGYLHDFCAFQIEVSDTPRGISPEPSLDLVSNYKQTKNIARMEWEMPDSLCQKFETFEIYRRVHPNVKSEYVGEVPLVSNAFGECQQHYFFEDTIDDDATVYYTLTAREMHGKSMVFDTKEFHYRAITDKPKQIPTIEIPLENLKNKTPIGILVYDYHTMQLLEKRNFTYKRGDPELLKLPTYKFTNIGVNKIKVELIDYKKQTKTSFDYTLESQ